MEARSTLPICLFSLALTVIAAPAALPQQPAARRPLTHKDYASWRTIQAPQLSRDGKFLAYGLFPQEGDGELVVRDLTTGKERRETAGAIPDAPDVNPLELGPDEEPPRRSIRLAFTGDSRFVVASTFPSLAETEKARKEKKRPEEMPKGGLVILNLASGAVTRIPGVKSFQVPEKGEAWVAYLKEAKPADKSQGKPAEDPKPTSPTRRKEYGTQLVLRDPKKPEPNERTFEDVLEYTFSKDGRTLVYTVSSRKEESNGVYSVSAAGGVPASALLTGRGKYTRLTWDRPQAQLAFLSDRDDAAARQPKFKLYVWNRGAAQASEAVSTAMPGFREGYILSERGPLSFSRDARRLFLPCAPAPAPVKESAPAGGTVLADLWHWKDDYIPPMQKVRARRDRARTYTAVFHLAEKKFVQLADVTMQNVHPSDDGRYALGSDDRDYRRMVDFDGNYADYYLVDTATGNRRELVDRLRSGYGAAPAWAPDGGHILYFRDKHWRTISVPGGIEVNLTAGLGVDFSNEDDDRPEPAGSYGTAGWTRDGKFVILYDRFDVWQVSADGQNASVVTGGYGRREKLQFRVVRLEGEDDDAPRGIDREKALLLRSESLETRDTGFWRTKLDATGAPQRLLAGPRNYRAVAKAKDADVIALTASTFSDFPDLQLTDSSFRELRKVSGANPQKAQLLWGSGELVRYRNSDGVPLQAALFKPEGFDPARKYPMLVYIYERLSQNLHNFVDPKPGTSINAAYYVSNGYLVLMPDIVYTVGSPGQSALKCVLPAIQTVVDQGFVDEDAIGIQGHSWGGYQVAYMVTQTRRFRAAEAGAPVGNMTSAYNGIRWGSGLPRQFQYEKSQSRIGGTLWEYPMRFVENSPIFMVDRVQTPLLILHDDQDDAVPWYQGIELFLSLRRLGKEAYLFNYNGEAHGLRKRYNQKDYTVRMQQFFDHFLKGAPKPEWMENGIPYLEREQKFN